MAAEKDPLLEAFGEKDFFRTAFNYNLDEVSVTHSLYQLNTIKDEYSLTFQITYGASIW